MTQLDEDERAGGAAADAELVLFLADGEAGRAFLDEEGGELFYILPGPHWGWSAPRTWRRR